MKWEIPPARVGFIGKGAVSMLRYNALMLKINKILRKLDETSNRSNNFQTSSGISIKIDENTSENLF